MTPMDAARAALKEVFGYDDFRPGQEDAAVSYTHLTLPTISRV